MKLAEMTWPEVESYLTTSPGTISLRAQTFTAVVYDVITSLVGHGFARLYVVNGHGADLAPIRAALHGAPAEHRRRFPDARVGSHSALATPEQGADYLDFLKEV